MTNQLVEENNQQRPHIYNKYSPFYDSIQRQSVLLFDEIRENLSRTIQLDELEPGFTIWSKKLKDFILLYGLAFNKNDHLKLIQFYLSILSIPDLNYRHVKICFDMLHELLRRTHLIKRDDLIINWRIFYTYAKIIFDYDDKSCQVFILPENIRISLDQCVHSSSPYFSSTATEEILNEFRPQMCPIDSSFNTTIKMFELFLPVILPPDLHNQGFKLWLNEFFTIWENISNISPWELFMMMIFSSLAWNNIGHVNWEPWLSQIFTRFLRGFSLPIGKMQVSSQDYSYLVPFTTKWIVAMIGNGNSCLDYLRDLLFSIKSFYHPSNTDEFQENLVSFIVGLARDFVDRVHLERRIHPYWYCQPVESYRLTEQDITNFVNCIKDYALISIFNKDYDNEAAEACQYLSILRPELIIPTIIEKYFSSIENLTEPHRLISILNSLKHIARQIVQQTPTYSGGQIYVLPLLMSVLPAIDLNDMEKTFATLDFLETILSLITCIDCSSAIQIRNDLTEIEKEVCLSTSKFEDFIIDFLNRIFYIIDILSANISDGIVINNDLDFIDLTIQVKLSSTLCSIVQHCNNQIFHKIREKIVNYTFDKCLSSSIQDIVSSLIEGLVKGNPEETLKYFLPKASESINDLLKTSDINCLSTNEKQNLELTWYLILFEKLVHARGDVLLNYKQMILSIFQQCIQIIEKNSYEIVANAAKSLLESLTQLYPIEYRLTTENINQQSFEDFLPIRSWGKAVDYDKLQVQFHIPNDDEIAFASEFVNTFIYPELTLLNEKNSVLTNNQRLKSLTLIQSIATGCFSLVPRIQSDQVKDLIPTVVPYDSKHQIQYSIYFKELKLKENLRMRLLIDIGKLLDELIENNSDDVSSIIQASDFYSYISIYYGLYATTVKYSSMDLTSREELLQNKLCSKGQSIRPLAIERILIQIQKIQTSQYGILTEIDKEILLKLFDLSLNCYSEVRQRAQMELFNVLNSYQFSYEIILDPIVELLNSSDEVDHDKIKGCLYILLGDNTFFLPIKSSWKMREKLWPSIVSLKHVNKVSTQKLIKDIGEKIRDDFVTDIIIQNTNELSKQSAIDLWQRLKSNEERRITDRSNSINIQSYHNLIETLCSLLKTDSLTWQQQAMTMSFLCLLLQKQVPIPLTCIEIFINSLVDDNFQRRKFAEKGLALICHLQKPARVYVEKSLEDILRTNNVLHEHNHPGDRDDNLWLTIDDYIPPKTQIEWEQTCFLDKVFYGYYTWPNLIRYSLNKRDRYTSNNNAIIYEYFSNEEFLIEYIDCLILNEAEDDEDEDVGFNENRFAMVKGLFRNYGLAFFDNSMNQINRLVHDKSIEKQQVRHYIASEILAGMIRGSKYWTLEMLDELWGKLRPFLDELWINLNSETLTCWSTSFKYMMENIDPRRMYQLIDFFQESLINNKTLLSTTNELTRWTLLQRLNHFQWRIPSLWCQINEQAKLLLNHPSEDVRYRLASILSLSISFDIKLFDGKAIRHPNAEIFINDICDRLQQAIEIYERTALMDISEENIEMNEEARQALNFIETVIRMHTSFYFWCRQPIKNATIRLFSYLCELENISTNDETFKENLTMSRLYVGISYLNANLLELLIEQLIKVCTNSKWHARRAAMEFVQNMIFCNFFNARPYAKQLSKLVINCLFDEQIEVRTNASITLSGLYQCGYISVTNEDLEYFSGLSNTNYFNRVDGKKVIVASKLVQRHAGVLGLCAIVLSSPYDIPIYLPRALTFLCEHSNDPNIIQISVRKCLSEFRRTHQDSWHEHREQFTDDQLGILADVLISHSYYA